MAQGGVERVESTKVCSLVTIFVVYLSNENWHPVASAHICPGKDLVKFLTPENGLQGYWDPYPIDMEFRPPCMVISTIGLSKQGKLEGENVRQCSTHLHQLHVCLPSSRNKTRLLYRMSLDFAPLLKHVPFINILWKQFAEKVLNEDLRLVEGQQERMLNGENIWNWPVGYDKLGIWYRIWRDALERGSKKLPFDKSTK